MNKKLTQDEIEAEIIAKKLTAPRITLAHIGSLVKEAQYHVFPGTQVTVCCLTLTNGSSVIGKSGCVSPENFNAELGQQVAYGKAMDEIWALEGYLLSQKLYEANLAAASVRTS